MQRAVILAAGLGAVAAAAMAAVEGGPRLAVAVGVGLVAGAALYHAAFGFTGGWRRFQRERRGAGLRAQLLLIALAACAAFPLIAAGDAFGRPVSGWVFPIGASTAIGAAMFGFGMQLGGGCGSGTLFTAGGGSTRMLLTLAAFIAGSVIWTGTNPAFQAALGAAVATLGVEGPAQWRGVSLLSALGWPLALAATLAALGTLALVSVRLEKRRHGALETPPRTAGFWTGPWSRELGAVVLAGVVVATFLTLGRPWGITSAFPLWGAKIVDAAGLPIDQWRAWSGGQLDRAIFADATGVMNFGVMLGALAAAGLAGRFAPTLRLTPRDAATAIIGGLLMGYGARLAFGCNIGGFVGGVVSGSLHGWWWLLFGWIGSWAGVLARARLGMDPPRAPAPRRAAKGVAT